MEPTYGDYDVMEVAGIEELLGRIKSAQSAEDWSFILSDYMVFGNRKLSKNVGIMNISSAVDCENADTERCQVPWSDCYAHMSEKIYDQTLAFRRRQEYLWDCLDAHTFAEAFNIMVERKRNEVTAIRFCQSGDFRHRGDVIKVDRIAELIPPTIDVYTYSASSHIDWSDAENFTVNQSNQLDNFGDRLYSAVESQSQIPEQAVWCPHDMQKKKQGVSSEDAIQCGECKLCINKNGPDVYITLH